MTSVEEVVLLFNNIEKKNSRKRKSSWLKKKIVQQVEEVTNTMKCAFLISLVMGSMVASAQADICDCAGPAVRTNRAFNNKK